MRQRPNPDKQDRPMNGTLDLHLALTALRVREHFLASRPLEAGDLYRMQELRFVRELLQDLVAGAGGLP